MLITYQESETGPSWYNAYKYSLKQIAVWLYLTLTSFSLLKNYTADDKVCFENCVNIKYKFSYIALTYILSNITRLPNHTRHRNVSLRFIATLRCL